MNISDTQIKNGWKLLKFGDILDSSIKVLIKKNEYYDSIPMELVSSGRKFPTAFEYKKFTGSGVKFMNGDTIFARITPCLQNKKIAKVKDLEGGIGFGSTEFFIFRAKKGISNPDFVYYLSTDDTILLPAINSMVGASGRQRANEKVVKNIEILLPPLEDQNRIAEILSKYDDLIENNEKRIKILESMAQKLYTEWFVNFKFPGYEKVTMIDSGHPDFGTIPDGWGVLKILDIGKVVTGKTPSTSNQEFYGGNTLFIKTPDIHGNIFITDSIQTLSDKGVENQKAKTLPPKTVFVSCIGTIGSVGITSRDSQTNQQINAVILKNNNDYIYLYFFISSLKKELINLGSNGATMGNVNKDKFENITLLYPERKILDSFFESSKDIFDEILNLQQQKQNLKKSRDMLIPPLVGGKINL